MQAKKKTISKKGIAAIMLISSLTVMVGNAITPALPELGVVYDLGQYASWLVTAPALGVVLTTVFFGKLIDKKGPYRVAFFGLFCYGLFGVAGGYMPNVAAIFIDRLLLGAATGAIMNTSVAFISAFFNGEKQLKMLAMQSMAMEFGGVIFLSVSGMLSDISWRCPFYIYALGFIAFLGLVFFIPKAERQTVGAIEETGVTADDTAPQKGVPIQLILLIAFLGMLTFFTAMVSLPIYLQNQLGYSPTFTGYYLAVLDLVAVLAAGLTPQIIKKVQEKGCLCIAFFCYGIAFLQYFLFANPVSLWLSAIFAGIAFGFSTPLFNNLVVNKSTPENKGTNISLCTMVMFAGQFLSALLVSALPAKRLFLLAALVSFVITLSILPVVKKYRR